MGGCIGLGVLISVMSQSAPADAATREDLRAILSPILTEVPVTGLLVFDVIPGSAADAAGLLMGDILTHYDGQPVASHAELSSLARTAATDKRPEILLLVHRDGAEVETALKPGPIGVRLEDVVEGERRDLAAGDGLLPTSNYVDPVSDERWFLFLRTDDPTPIGWSHHRRTISTSDSRGQHLGIRQQMRLTDSRLDQFVEARFTPVGGYPLTALNVRFGDKLTLEMTRSGETWNGRRMGIEVSAPYVEAVSAYTLPYLVESLAAASNGRFDIAYLPPGSVEAAPLCRLDIEEVAGQRHVVIRKFGRVELVAETNGKGRLSRVTGRDGMAMIASTMEDVRRHFPEAAPIDIPARDPLRDGVKAN